MVIESNPRRRRRKARSHNRRGKRRGRRSNPGMSFRRPLGALTSGFKPSNLMDALPIAGGALLNFWAQGLVGSRVPMLGGGGVVSYITGLGLAGGSLLIPKVGPKMFLGGVTFQLLRGINQYLMPGALKLGELISGYNFDGDDGLGELVQNLPMSGMRGMGDLVDSISDLPSVGDDYDIYGVSGHDGGAPKKMMMRQHGGPGGSAVMDGFGDEYMY